MTQFLLDTNHASPLVTSGHPLRARVLRGFKNGNTFALSAPVLAESLFRLRLIPRAEQNVKEWGNLRKLIGFYIPDEVDAEQAAELQVALRRRGRQLETVDALVAAVALRYELVLLTTDRDFDAVHGLRCENWLRATL